MVCSTAIVVELGQEALGEGPPAVTEPDELALNGDDHNNDDNDDNGKMGSKVADFDNVFFHGF